MTATEQEANGRLAVDVALSTTVKSLSVSTNYDSFIVDTLI